MKILPVRLYNINFKNNDDNVIAYDDAISKETREYIIEHYQYENMPYQSIYEKEPRLDEYQLKNLVNFFVNKPKKIGGDIMSELPISNLRNISVFPRYKPNIYWGAARYDAPEWVLKKIKTSGD